MLSLTAGRTLNILVGYHAPRVSTQCIGPVVLAANPINAGDRRAEAQHLAPRENKIRQR
jgi:hypothetical protein